MNLGTGRFLLGCNYWASHTGIKMWRDWRPEIVEEDFRKLAALGLDLLRVFPLWPDFQPLHLQYGHNHQPYEYCWPDDEVIPRETDGTVTGVDPEMVARLRWMCDLAERHHLTLGIGLVTGWMSGRLWAPPAFANKNLLTDPAVIRWQLKLVRSLVRELKDHPAIAYWGPGNECNCMSPADRDQSYWWLASITSAIRAEDGRHPVLAGLHSLLPEAPERAGGNPWGIQDMGEIFDGLTTHPYPEFTPYSAVDRLTGVKNIFHPAAESRFYTDMGRKPCLAEEVGTLSPIVAENEIAAKYLENILFHLWSHGCEGLFWWCGFDQTELAYPPYEWCALERELGLFQVDGATKPVGETMKRFREFLQVLPFEELPEFHRDAVCVLSEGQDTWKNAWGAWVLAKQAGFSIRFCHWSDPLPDAELYLVPGLKGSFSLPQRCVRELMTRIEAGAVAYFSFDDAHLSPFEELFGLHVSGRERYAGASVFAWDGGKLPYAFNCRLTMTPGAGTTVLAAEDDGNPVFSEHAYGTGHVFFCAFPLENNIIEQNRRVEEPYWKLYQAIAAFLSAGRRVVSSTPDVTLTEHRFPDGRIVICAVNNSDEIQRGKLLVSAGFRIRTVYWGDPDRILPHSAAVFQVE